MVAIFLGIDKIVIDGLHLAFGPHEALIVLLIIWLIIHRKDT